MKIYLFTKYTYLYTKRGITRTILIKSIDKCHYFQTQNNYILALNNSPQLEFVCPQTRPNTQIAKVKIQRIKNQQRLEKRNNCTVQIKTYEQSKHLPQSYNEHENETNPKYKNHTKHSKTKQAQSRITPSKNSSVDEKHRKVRTLNTHPTILQTKDKIMRSSKNSIENATAQITRAFKVVMWLG